MRRRALAVRRRASLAAGLAARVLHPRRSATAGGFPRPTWPSVFRLVLLDVCVGTPLAFAIGGLEKADQAALGPPLMLMVLVFTLYADYAIVVDEVGLWQAFRASLHVLRAARAASLGATAAWLMLSFMLADALGPVVRQRRHAARPDGAARVHRRASASRSTSA